MPDHRLESLLAVAERVTVDLIAQQPVAVTPDQDTPAFALFVADRGNFDVIPLREPDGRIVRFVRRTDLRDVEDWNAIETNMIRIDDVISASSPILDLLERFDREQPLLFVLDRRSISGVATVYDLNQPAAHQFGFALALVVEAELAKAIEASIPRGEEDLDRDVDERMANVVAQNLQLNSRTMRRVRDWGTKLRQGDQLRLLNDLVLYDKIELVQQLGIAPALAERCPRPYGPDADRLLAYLRDDVRGLRNAVAHDGEALTDEWKIWEWMRTTLHIARSLAVASGGLAV